MVTKIELIHEYAAMRTRIEDGIKELREEKKRQLKADIAALRKEHKQVFAIQLNKARDEGMKRDDLLDVLCTRSGDVLKEYVELGGGSMRRLKTGDERVAVLEEQKRASLNELLAKMGIVPSGEHDRQDYQTGRTYHHFHVGDTGQEFYLHEGAPWPLANASDEMYAWLKANDAAIRTELAPHYEED